MIRARDIVDSVCEGSSVLSGEPIYEKLSRDDKEEVDARVAKALKARDSKTEIRKIALGVLNDFVKALYVKRGFWSNDIT